MEEERMSMNTGGRGITTYLPELDWASLTRRSTITGRRLVQVILEYVKAPTAKAELEKVTNTVGTFLNKGSSEAAKERSDSLRIGKVTTNSCP